MIFMVFVLFELFRRWIGEGNVEIWIKFYPQIISKTVARPVSSGNRGRSADKLYELFGVFRGLRSDMVVKENVSLLGLGAHMGKLCTGPLVQLFIGVVVVELLLHIAGAPPLGVTTVKA